MVRVLAVVVVLRAAPVQAWQQRIGPVGIANSIAPDPAGNVVVVGLLQDPANPGGGVGVLKLDGVSGTELWRDTHFFPNGAFLNSAVVDSAGDVIEAGADATVAKFSGGSGALLWTTVIPGAPHPYQNRVHAIARDVADDVIGAGSLAIEGVPGVPNNVRYEFLVFKLSGSSGAQLWRRDISGIPSGDTSDVAFAVTTDASGDVIAAGCIDCGVATATLAVVKFDGASGNEIWRTLISGPPGGHARAIALDGAGDVIVVGDATQAAFDTAFLTVKLSGATGAELWRSVINGSRGFGDVAFAVAIDGVGDAFVAGVIENNSTFDDFAVVKLSGASGAELWRREVSGAANLDDGALSLALDGSGDAIAAGSLDDGNGSDFTVIKLSGDSGADLWRRQIDGNDTLSQDEARRVALDGAGNVYVAGVLHAFGEDRFTVVKLNGTHGGIGTLAGRKLRVTDKLLDPTRRRIIATAEDLNLDAPVPGSSNDPITAGAKLRLVGAADDATFVLPPGPQWRAASPNGYKYSDPTGANGPCRRLEVRPGKRLKALCLGRLGNVPFSLDEPTQGALTLSLQFGVARPQCMRFGGTILRDLGTGNPAPMGSFIARDAPPTELGCPEP